MQVAHTLQKGLPLVLSLAQPAHFFSWKQILIWHSAEMTQCVTWLHSSVQYWIRLMQAGFESNYLCSVDGETIACALAIANTTYDNLLKQKGSLWNRNWRSFFQNFSNVACASKRILGFSELVNKHLNPTNPTHAKNTEENCQCFHNLWVVVSHWLSNITPWMHSGMACFSIVWW